MIMRPSTMTQPRPSSFEERGRTAQPSMSCSGAGPSTGPSSRSRLGSRTTVTVRFPIRFAISGLGAGVVRVEHRDHPRARVDAGGEVDLLVVRDVAGARQGGLLATGGLQDEDLAR